MAARAKTLLLLLAALCLPAFAHVPRPSLVVQKPHQGVERFAQPSHRGPGDANALTAPGLARCLYDKGRRSRSTAKERDDESGLDYFKARYYSASLGRFTSPDPVGIAKQKLVDPQQWDMYAYGRNNPLRFIDPTGRLVELTGTEDERKKVLDALKAGVGNKAAQYLTVKKDSGFLGLGKTHYYVATTDAKAFAGTNAIANKVGGMINDTGRTAVVQLVAPGTKIGGYTIGSVQQGLSPALTGVLPVAANVSITSGPLGSVPGNLMSNNQNTPATLPEVLIHELGHVDAGWYHGGLGPQGKTASDGDAVRIENLVRQLEGAPSRLGHDQPYDVPLTGLPY